MNTDSKKTETEQCIIHGVMPTLLCVDGFNNGEITKGHKYTIIKENHFNYYMVNNFGKEDFYHKSWFKKLNSNNNQV